MYHSEKRRVVERVREEERVRRGEMEDEWREEGRRGRERVIHRHQLLAKKTREGGESEGENHGGSEEEREEIGSTEKNGIIIISRQ